MKQSKVMGRPRSEDSRKQIIDAALAELRDGSYERLSFENVASRAGVGKSTIYRWYETKEDLVAEALTRYEFVSEVPNTGSLAGDIEAIVRSSMASDALAADRRSFVSLMSAMAASERLSNAYWESYIKPRKAIYNVVFLRAKERGEFALAADPDDFSELLHGGIALLLLSRSESPDLPKEAKRLTELLLKGFGQR